MLRGCSKEHGASSPLGPREGSELFRGEQAASITRPPQLCGVEAQSQLSVWVLSSSAPVCFQGRGCPQKRLVEKTIGFSYGRPQNRAKLPTKELTLSETEGSEFKPRNALENNGDFGGVQVSGGW